MRPLVLLLALACHTPDDDATDDVGLDLTERLAAGATRAGIVTDPAALVGGISAEGRPGDAVLYNDRVRFVIQGARVGNYYVGEGGGVIDADIVRPEGEPGHDLVEEMATVINTTTLIEPSSLTIVHDGSNGEPAHLRVDGVEAPLALIGGSLEAPELIQTAGVELAVDYILPADSWLLETRVTVRATKDLNLIVSDVLISAPEAASAWRDRTGFYDDDGGAHRQVGYIDRNAAAAVAMFGALGTELQAGALGALSSATDLVAGGGASVRMTEGQEVSVSRYYGVGPDMAVLTEAWDALSGTSSDAHDGVVTAPDGPVAGALVHLLVDGEPYTVARTGADGAFHATAPAGAAVSLRATGGSDALFTDLPAGSGPMGPYAPSPARETSLASLTSGSAAVPAARGRGVASEADGLTLAAPVTVHLVVDDGLPFTAWLDPLDAAPTFDPRIQLGGPGGHAAGAFARDGAVDVAVVPGRYRVVMHRGLRYEVWTGEINATGAELTVTGTLPAAYAQNGWLLGDPHSHAAPSGDASISMEDRLIVHAANGYQLHFGTDHDHIANYRPLLGPLGLTSLATVIADEVSPPLRGHFNIYPVEPRDEPNGGAWTWWTLVPESTEAMFATLRSRQTDFILQSNHPLDSGLGASAGWSPGMVEDGNKWGDDLDAIEVNNSGDIEFLSFYLDLLNRGVVTTPTGVTDSHAHFAGGPGVNGTFIGVSKDDPADMTDADLVAAMRSRRTIVTRGPFLLLSVEPGSVITAPTTVEVETFAPSWIQVTRLRLLTNGVETARIEGNAGSFDLTSGADASFVVIAEGDAPMQPVSGNTPWAMASPILLDLAGDGWDPPLPPLSISR
jgi:hypothetical protein